MRRLLALKDLVHDAIEKTTNLVEETHESVAEKPFRVMDAIPGLGETAHVVDDARRLTTAAVFDTIRATNQGIRMAEDASIALARTAAASVGFAPETLALRAEQNPALARLSRWADFAQGALNGVVGDFLKEQDNGLGIAMAFRHGGEDLELHPEALGRILADGTDKLCVFVHGLGVTEWAWSFLAQELHGDPNVNFGTLIRKDLGFTPLFVRYNTGLHVSENGRELAQLLDALVAAYPGDTRQIVLVGHSMGGLVARSAAHYGKELGAAWVSRLSHVFSIGSPHLGAPLEKAGNVLSSILSFFDTPGTQVPAKILNARSRGIKDLRYGYVVDQDWEGKSPDAYLEDNRQTLPFVDSVTYAFIASTLTVDPNHPVGQLLGDVLVRLPSAAGFAKESERSIPFHIGHVVGGAHHLELMNHPEVYAEILRCLTLLPAEGAGSPRHLPRGSSE